MSVLLRSGGLVLQAETSGYQFYELQLRPGFHYIPFNPELGRFGAGNLVSRLQWAKDNDHISKEIAMRSESLAVNCLSEKNIDYFVVILLSKYSQLLKGRVLNFPLVDLSQCIQKSHQKEYSKIARLCKGVIEKCWLY